MIALSLACGYVPGASLRTALPVVRRTGAHHVQLQLGEETRDVEEMVFHPAPPPDARSLLVPTDASSVALESSVVVLPHPKKVKTGGEDASFSRDGYYAVFDGVSGWARKGVDAGAFSRELAANTANALDRIQSSGYHETPLRCWGWNPHLSNSRFVNPSASSFASLGVHSNLSQQFLLSRILGKELMN